MYTQHVVFTIFVIINHSKMTLPFTIDSISLFKDLGSIYAWYKWGKLRAVPMWPCWLCVTEKKIDERRVLGSAGHCQLFQMIHKHLKTHVVCQNGCARLLHKHRKCDSISGGVGKTILEQAEMCLYCCITMDRHTRLINIPHIGNVLVLVRYTALTWPHAYMLLWVWEGFTLERRKRAWRGRENKSR